MLLRLTPRYPDSYQLPTYPPTQPPATSLRQPPHLPRLHQLPSCPAAELLSWPSEGRCRSGSLQKGQSPYCWLFCLFCFIIVCCFYVLPLLLALAARGSGASLRAPLPPTQVRTGHLAAVSRWKPRAYKIRFVSVLTLPAARP